MGYSYDRLNRLCCDHCGVSGGVRKRTCPRKVLTDSLRGPRRWLSYCYPPALCGDCYRQAGGSAIHNQCAEGAAASQVKYDEIEALLDAGEALSVAAWGQHDDVPAGMVGLLFVSRTARLYRLVPTAEYHNESVQLSQVTAQPWPGFDDEPLAVTR